MRSGVSWAFALALVFAGPVVASAAAPRFNYSYKVLAVRVSGDFTATYDSGDGDTFSGTEHMVVRGVRTGAKLAEPCWKGTCAAFRTGTLTLQNPPKLVGISGTLQTSPFERRFQVQAAETLPGGKRIDCSRTYKDREGFSGLMQLHGSYVVAFWNLPGLSFGCQHAGGYVDVDYYDRTSPQSSQAQFTVRYSLAAFRSRRFELEVDIRHAWRPDSHTRANVRWQGFIELERVANRRGK